MSDAPHTIPDHLAARVARLINEAEDMRQQAADDLKQIYADLREELRGMGWVGSVVSAEVAALKGAIAEIRLDDEKKAKREEKGERVGDYVSLLSRARAREGLSYSEAKGMGDAVGNTDAIPHDPETGELTDNQESVGTVAAGTSAVSPASDESETDDVGATASSTNSEMDRVTEGSIQAGSEAAENARKAIPAGPEDGSVSHAGAGEIPATHSNSQASPLKPADSAGEAPSSSQASPATDTDDDGDDDVPAFIKQNKPDCLKLKDGHCRLSFATSALCAECNQRRAMARALA